MPIDTVRQRCETVKLMQKIERLESDLVNYKTDLDEKFEAVYFLTNFIENHHPEHILELGEYLFRYAPNIATEMLSELSDTYDLSGIQSQWNYFEPPE